MSRVRKVLTFSNVVACLALFFALGGSVYAAGKISGKRIKPKTLPGNRVKPKTLPGNRIKPKSVTRRQIKAKTLTGHQVKPHSLTGVQIRQGTLTGVAAASLSGVQYAVATAALTNFQPTTATASCPAGTYIIGGGATLNNEDSSRINSSGPTPTRTGWTATGFRFGPDAEMIVTAICVAVTTPVGSGPGPAPDYQPAD